MKIGPTRFLSEENQKNKRGSAAWSAYEPHKFVVVGSNPALAITFL